MGRLRASEHSTVCNGLWFSSAAHKERAHRGKLALTTTTGTSGGADDGNQHQLTYVLDSLGLVNAGQRLKAYNSK